MTDVTLIHERARAAPGMPTAVTGRHLPALNGLRGLAVIGVVAYHLQLGWARGGYLGVDLFFVLSGFLITTLLLEEWRGTGHVDLAAFWGRRARRLLPALFLVVAALALYVVCNAAFGGPGANGHLDLPGIRGDAIATLLYVNNWHLVFAHQSYFAQFSTPSPLQHTWSLAIEEQFYLVWPLLLLLLFRVTRRGWRQAGVAVTVSLGVLSAVLMAVLFHPGVDPSRVYYGTDTRLFDLMAGAMLAFLAAARPQPGPASRRALHVMGPLAAAVLGVFWVTAGTSGGLPTTFMFEGGFLLCAALAALVVSDARLAERGAFSRALSWGPLHFVGTISYGIYLWHWPVIVYLTGARTGLGGWQLDLVRVGVTLAVSTASFYLVERPIRRAHLHGSVRFWGAPLAGVVSAVVIVVATMPAVADPGHVVGTTHLRSASPAQAGQTATVPGAGGYAGQVPIRLAAPPSPANPLRITVIGDSVMHDASFAIRAALESTGDSVVTINTVDGWGLGTDPTWKTDLPWIISQSHPQLIVATWSWDDWGPTTPNALYQPAAYTKELEDTVSTLLTPGNGVEGVIFTQFPEPGAILTSADPRQRPIYRQRVLGNNAWNHIAQKMTTVFPGKVMFFPIASSLLWHGNYAAWLPPDDNPHAPLDTWIRVRKVDNVHLCPQGAALYTNALLADMTPVFGLSAAAADWSQGSWTTDPNFNNPPGACPDDHPPG
jgi:peptidoglycan/LPS O-acetylase OafA/YrhL